MNYPKALREIIKRLRGVVIENRPAIQVIQKHDGPETLHYVDPPYVAETRDPGRDYRYEMMEADHVELAKCLNELKGAVVLSGYDSELYRKLYSDWHRREKDTVGDGATKRREILWMKNTGLLV